MIQFIIYIFQIILSYTDKITAFLLKLFTGFLWLTFVSCNAQIDGKTLEKNLTEIQNQSNLPGFTVAIIKNDSVQFSQGFGFANKETKTPFTPETILPIGSVSKTFIGFSIMKAVDLGYFTLQTNINDILPFKVINPNHPNEIITINHLVTHTSGLIDNEKQYIKAYNAGKKPTIELGDFLKKYYLPNGEFYAKANYAKTKPGENYYYSNMASALAAYIIEVKANKNFAEFTMEYIFNPLKMYSSHWFYDEAFANKYATLYQIDKPDYPFKEIENPDGSLKPYSCASYPDGSLKTSAADLTKYMIAMLNGFDGKSDLLSKTSFETLFKKQFDEKNMPKNMDPKEPNRAIFWAYNKKNKIMHTGADPGVASFVSIDPKTKISRVILFNTALDGQENDKTVEDFMKIIGEIEKFELGLK